MGTLHTLPPRAIAVFVSPEWRDQNALRLWAKMLEQPAATGGVQVEIVFLTDELHDGNAVLARQLRCSRIVCAVARLPTVLRSQAELDKARRTRDTTLAKVADVVCDFGGAFVGCSDKPITVIPLEPL